MRISKNIFSFFVFGIPLSVFGLLSCGNPAKIPHKPLDRLPNLDLAKTTSNGKDSLIYSFPYRFQKNTYEAGLYEGKDSLFCENYSLKNKKTWQKQAHTRFKNIGKILKVDSSHVQDSIYLFLAYLPKNKRSRNTIFFSLINPITGKVFSLRYQFKGDYIQLSSTYQVDALTKSYPVHIHELEKKANLFSHPTRNGLSINLPQPLDSIQNKSRLSANASQVKRWVMLNDRVYDETQKKGSAFQLNIEESMGNISPNLQDFQNNDSLYKTNVSISENSQYKISSLKKGPVFCFNKSQNKSFLIWVPEDSSHFIRSVRLRGNQVQLFDSVLVAKSKLKPILEFNLSQKTIKKIN